MLAATLNDARPSATAWVIEWWRRDGYPTAGEWQAFWGFTTFAVALIAAAIAMNQVLVTLRANRAASDANRMVAEASIAAMRPYVIVSFEFDPAVPKNPKSSTDGGFVLVVIENIGKTPALDLTLKSKPDFETSDDGAPTDGKGKMLNWIREKFSGEYVFRYLPPGRRHEYVLDTTSGLMKPDNGLPQVYEVEARYRSQSGIKDEFIETNVLDAEPWHMSAIRADPAIVMAQQLKRHNETTENHNRAAMRLQEDLVRHVQDHAAPPSRPSRASLRRTLLGSSGSSARRLRNRRR